MTEYRKIRIKKRDFNVRVELPELSETAVSVFGGNILWDDNTEILWDDNTEILWDDGTTIGISANPRVVHIKKRNFNVRSEVNNG